MNTSCKLCETNIFIFDTEICKKCKKIICNKCIIKYNGIRHCIHCIKHISENELSEIINKKIIDECIHCNNYFNFNIKCNCKESIENQKNINNLFDYLIMIPPLQINDDIYHF